MKFGIVILGSIILFTLLVQCQFQTSVSRDAQLFGQNSLSSGTYPANSEAGLRFSAVRSIMQTRCLSCHSNFLSMTEEQWVSSGYVVINSPNTSTLFTRLTGAIPGGSGDMPKSAAPLSTSEIGIFRSWIEGISLADSSPTSLSSGASLNAAQRTAAALNLIKTSCIQCHDAPHTATSGAHLGATIPAFANAALFSSDHDFSIAGLISPGSPTNSWLYQSLKVYGTIKTMPPTGPLTQSQAQILSTWITGSGQP